MNKVGETAAVLLQSSKARVKEDTHTLIEFLISKALRDQSLCSRPAQAVTQTLSFGDSARQERCDTRDDRHF